MKEMSSCSIEDLIANAPRYIKHLINPLMLAAAKKQVGKYLKQKY